MNFENRKTNTISQYVPFFVKKWQTLFYKDYKKNNKDHNNLLPMHAINWVWILNQIFHTVTSVCQKEIVRGQCRKFIDTKQP